MIALASLVLAASGTTAAATTSPSQAPTPGAIDSTFNIGEGPASPEPPDGVNAIAVQADGKSVVLGFFQSLAGTVVNGIARLNPDCSADPTFNAGSGVDTADRDEVRAIAPQLDGRVLIGGSFASFNGLPFPNLVRLLPSGAVDTGCGTPDVGPNRHGNSILLQPDGKILAGGFFLTYDGTAANDLARLHGTPIPTPQEPQSCGDLPKQIARSGVTVILPRTCLTNADQAVQVSATGRLRGDLRLFRLIHGTGGKVKIRTYGHRIKLRLTESAPAIHQYSAYFATKSYKV